MNPILSTLAGSALLAGLGAPALAQETTAPAADIALDPRTVEGAAAQVFRRGCAHLKSLERFSLRSEASYDEVLESGLRLEYSRDSRVLVERPDRFRIETESDKGYRLMWYDGERITLADPDLNVYARFDAPDTIDATLDAVAERGVTMPLDDLLYSDPCAAFGASVEEGYYVGLNFVEEAYLHHLLLVTAAVDVQLWIEDDDTPLIRKVIITYHDAPGEPQFRARLSEWDEAPKIAPDTFEFAPPDGAHEIDFRPSGSVDGGDAR